MKDDILDNMKFQNFSDDDEEELDGIEEAKGSL